MNIKSFYLFFLIGGLFYSHSQSQVLWQVSGDKITKWNYLDGDEFNSNSIDTSKWQDAYPWGRNLYCSFDRHYYTEFKNCTLQDGILSLVAKRESIKARAVPYESDSYRLMCNGKDVGVNLQTFDYTCGMIFSKKKYHYGYFEMKFKSQDGKGLWPAFWLYAGHENDEIDIFELNGSRNNDLHVDVHCKKGCNNYKTTLGLLRKNWGDYLTTSGNWNNGYNIIGAEWQPQFVKWYLNGKVVAYWKGKFEYPMWVIADIAIARDDGPFKPGPDAATKFPAALDIDYIRIWSKQVPPSKQHSQVTLEIPKDINSQKSKLVKGKKPESKRKYMSSDQTFILFSPAEGNIHFVELTGSEFSDFVIEVSDASGKNIYTSQDSHQLLHKFELQGHGILRINADGNSIEHSF